MGPVASSSIPASYNGDYSAWLADEGETVEDKITMDNPSSSDKERAKEACFNIKDNAQNSINYAT